MSEFAGDVEFAKLLSGRCDIDLVQLMLELASDAYPQLDRMGCLLEIDRLSVACEARGAGTQCSSVKGRLKAVSHLLYEVEGFHGNREAYYEPQNSYLNEVLARRTGIPISLGVLYIAVASRLGLHTFGVNTPGHFMVGCHTDSGMLFVDAFNGGEVLDRKHCKRRVEEMMGEVGVLCNEHLRPAPPLDITARVLRNLKAAYAMNNDWAAALPVQRRLAALLPEAPQEQRDLGLIYLRTGAPKQALELLEGYASQCPQEQESLQSSLRTARKMVAELN